MEKVPTKGRERELTGGPETVLTIAMEEVLTLPMENLLDIHSLGLIQHIMWMHKNALSDSETEAAA